MKTSKSAVKTPTKSVVKTPPDQNIAVKTCRPPSEYHLILMGLAHHGFRCPNTKSAVRTPKSDCLLNEFIVDNFTLLYSCTSFSSFLKVFGGNHLHPPRAVNSSAGNRLLFFKLILTKPPRTPISRRISAQTGQSTHSSLHVRAWPQLLPARPNPAPPPVTRTPVPARDTLCTRVAISSKRGSPHGATTRVRLCQHLP